MSTVEPQWLKLGHVSGVHGVRGWIKVHSYADPAEKILEYQPWQLALDDKKQIVEAVDSKFSGKVLLVSLDQIQDRDEASELVSSEIWVPANQLPSLDPGEYYWHQLEGLRVTSRYEGEEYLLGCVERMLETGANDVLVVKGDQDSIDQKERLIPYLINQTVLDIDLDQKRIQVEWDPDF